MAREGKATLTDLLLLVRVNRPSSHKSGPDLRQAYYLISLSLAWLVNI